jgi:hypothetical protein
VDNSVNGTYKSNFINPKKVNYVLKKYQLILGQTIENGQVNQRLSFEKHSTAMVNEVVRAIRNGS